jgi:hypothetical protein
VMLPVASVNGLCMCASMPCACQVLGGRYDWNDWNPSFTPYYNDIGGSASDDAVITSATLRYVTIVLAAMFCFDDKVMLLL